jgi:hypothetical protein
MGDTPSLGRIPDLSEVKTDVFGGNMILCEAPQQLGTHETEVIPGHQGAHEAPQGLG